MVASIAFPDWAANPDRKADWKWVGPSFVCFVRFVLEIFSWIGLRATPGLELISSCPFLGHASG